MLVTPLPGVNRDYLLTQLQSQHRSVSNLYGGGVPGGGVATASDRLFAYLEWASTAAAVLSTQVSAADIDRLVLTRRYELLVSGGVWHGDDNNTEQRSLNALVSLELNERVAAFERACTALTAQIARWQQLARFVVLDTSVFIEHENKLKDLDLAGILKSLEYPIHVLVPMMVIDELDNGKRQLNGQKRFRAAYSLAVIDQTVRSGGVLRERDLAAVRANTGVPVPGRITLEVVSDPPRHVRLPIPDDEIVDRARAAQALAGSSVTIVTFDTGMSLRAREADVAEIKLGDPPMPQ